MQTRKPGTTKYGKYTPLPQTFFLILEHTRMKKKKPRKCDKYKLRMKKENEKAKFWTSLPHSKKLFEDFIVAKKEIVMFQWTVHMFLHKTSWLAMN